MNSITVEKLPRANSPEEVGVSSQTVISFLQDLNDSGILMHNFMLIRHGKVFAEGSWSPYKADIPHQLFSFSKSVTSTAIGFCIDEGRLSLEDKVISFFPDKQPKKMTEDSQNLTIRHLLTMHSGKKFDALSDKSSYDWVEDFMNTPFTYHPGEQFEYINENTFMLSAIVTRVTGMPMVDYLMPRLFEPLGISKPDWESETNGINAGGWGLYLPIEGMAKILQCYLNKGEFGGKQVIPRDWVEQATAKQVRNDINRGEDNAFESIQGYGYQIWRASVPNSYRFDGMFGQYGFVLPDYDAVLVTQAGMPGHNCIIRAFQRHFPEGYKDGVLPEDPEALAELREMCRNLALDDLPQDKRNSKMEYLLEGRTIKVRKNKIGMLSQAVITMMAVKELSIDNIRMTFHKDYMDFAWSEKDVVNKIKIGLGDEAYYDQMHLCGMDFITRGKATWHEDGSLEVRVRAMETVQERRFIFKFKGKKVKIITGSQPDINILAGTTKKYIEKVIPVRFLVPLCKVIFDKFAGLYMEPNISGRIV